MGMGLEMGGFCTPWKSYCCADLRTCGGETNSRISYFENPAYPDSEQKPLGTCGTKIKVEHNVCNLRVSLEKFNIGMDLEGSCSNNVFAVTTDNNNTTLTLCGDKNHFQTVIPVSPSSRATLGFLLASSGSKWRIKISQEECGGGVPDPPILSETPDTFEELQKVCGRRNRKVGSKSAVDGRLPRRSNRRRWGRRMKRSPRFPDFLVNSNWIKDYVLEEVRNRKRIKLKKEKEKSASVTVSLDKRKHTPEQFFQTVTKSSMDISMVARDQLKLQPQHPKKKKVIKKKPVHTKKIYLKKSQAKKSPLSFLSSLAKVTLGTLSGSNRQSPKVSKLIANPKFSYKQVPIFSRSVFPASLGLSSESRSRLLFGTVASPGEFPWLAAVTWDGEFLCHATLITSRHALTTAHCILRPDAHSYITRLQVIAGENRIDIFGEAGEVSIPVAGVTVHPMFQRSSGQLDYDVSVLSLASRLNWTPTVSPVCWDAPVSNPSSAPLGRTVMVSWGNTNYGAAVVPHWAELPLVSSVACQAKLGLQVTEAQVCAGPGQNGREPCGSDSAAPLVRVDVDGHYSLVGLYSFSSSQADECSVSGLPHVFTNIGHLKSWIVSVTRTK